MAVILTKPVLSRQYKPGGKHPGFSSCDKCGVTGYIAEKNLIKKLDEGLALAKFRVVSVAPTGEKVGTLNTMLRPLMGLLRRKGMVVR